MLSSIRSWVYSFPGQYDQVVADLRKETANRFTEFDPMDIEPHLDWNSYDRATEFSSGSITVNFVVYDHSYTVLENCRVRKPKSFDSIDDKTATKTKNWVTVIKDEPNPDAWHSVVEPRVKAAQRSCGEVLPLPRQGNWPTFYGHKPFAVDDPSIGSVRCWYYTFRANWDDVVGTLSTDLKKRGYRRDPSYSDKRSVTFRRGELDNIGITLDDDSYMLFRDARGMGSFGTPSHTSPSPGWVFVARNEPVCGFNLESARKLDAEVAKSSPSPSG